MRGSYDAVRRYAKRWRAQRGAAMAEAFVSLSFAPGEAYQFDWSHEIVLINGVTVTVKVAHVRLCHSRMLFVRVYPRETQEMVFDAHNRAFAFFRGACTRGIYDNMKTAVEAVFIGKDRQLNRRFLQMCGHYLVEPTACTPVSGWEKGQVENQVGVVRERFFTPRLRVASYEELNAWLLDRCVAHAKAHKHPELTDRTIWQAFEAERPQLVQISGPFDGFHATQASVSKTCLLRFDNNKYSVASCAAGRTASSITATKAASIVAGIRQTLQRSRRAAVDGIGRRRRRQRDVRELLRDPRMRVAGTPPLCVAARGEDRLLQLHRRLAQPGAAAFRPRLPLAHGLRTRDRGPTNGNVINQARQHSTKTGQLHRHREQARGSVAASAFDQGRPLLSLIASLRDKKMLLVFDNCAHVIEAAAPLAVGIPEVHRECISWRPAGSPFASKASE